MSVLKARLRDKHEREAAAKEASARKSQIGLFFSTTIKPRAEARGYFLFDYIYRIPTASGSASIHSCSLGCLELQ